MVIPTKIMSLCSGYGGLDLAISLVIPESRTICHVERECYAAADLVARMENSTLPPAPIWDDVATFDGSPWRGAVDIVAAGYPCQPFSQAGKRRAEEDPRHLWPHIHRIIGEVSPAFVFLENVPGHLRLGFRDVAEDLRKMGYRVASVLVTAEEIGAPHKRERLFALAVADTHDPDRRRELQSQQPAEDWRPEPERGCCAVADAEGGQVGDLTKRSEPDEAERRDSIARDHWREAVADAHDNWGRAGDPVGGKERGAAHGGASAALADDYGNRLQAIRWEPSERQDAHRCGGSRFPPGPDPHDHRWGDWPAPSFEPGFRRRSHGASVWVDRLRLAGNGVVPLAAAHAFMVLFAGADDRG